jgi:hypothetical protein
MTEGQYILPLELWAIGAFVFLPAAVLAAVRQAIVLKRIGLFRQATGRAFAALSCTVAGGLAIGIGLFIAEPKELAPLLRMRELSIFGQEYPVLPLAYLSMGIAALLSTLWAQRSRPSAA